MGMSHSYSHSAQSLAGPVHLRRFLQRLGSTYIKVGQYLALRPDIVPQETCLELLELKDSALPLPFEEVCKVIAEDLGRPAQAVFSWLSPRPFATGFLAQTYAARTEDGAEVSVKVQRPGIRALIDRDLHRSRTIDRILQLSGAGPAASAREVADDIASWLHACLDYSAQVRNVMTLARRSRDREGAYLPTVYASLSGPRVITTEPVSAVPLLDVLSLLREGKDESIRSLDIGTGEVADNLLRTVLDQVFEFEFFQADLHPANILVFRGDSVGFDDFGLMENLDVEFRKSMQRFLAAIGADDPERIFEGLTDPLISGERADLTLLRADFFEELRTQRQQRQLTGETASPLSANLIAVLRVAQPNGFTVPPPLRRLYRTLLAADTLGTQLGRFNAIAALSQPLARSLQVDEVLHSLKGAQLQAAVLDGLSLMTDGPRAVRRILADLAEGNLSLRVRTVEAEEDARRSNLRVRMIIVAIASVAIALLIGGTQGQRFFGLFPLSWILWTLLLACWTWLTAHWRRLR